MIGGVDANYFWGVRSRSIAGEAPDDSDRAGEFDFR